MSHKLLRNQVGTMKFSEMTCLNGLRLPHFKRWSLKVFCVMSCVFAGLSAPLVLAEPTIERTVHISDIQALTLRGSGEMVIEIGDRESLRVVGAQSQVDALSVSAKDQHLHILPPKSISFWVFSSKQPLKYYLTLKKFNYLHAQGGASISVTGLIEGESFELNATGANKITLENLNVTETITLKMTGAGELQADNVTTQALMLNMTGAANATLKGRVQTQTIILTGATNYHGEHLESKQCDSQLNGASFAGVWATERLSVKARGASSVDYFGSPELTQSLSGASSISGKGLKPEQ